MTHLFLRTNVSLFFPPNKKLLEDTVKTFRSSSSSAPSLIRGIGMAAKHQSNAMQK